MTLRSLMVALAGLPLLAQAESFNYTSLEAGYVSTELDVGFVNVDGDGLGIRGAYEFADEWYAFAGLADLEFDFGVDGTEIDFGVGWHNSLSNTADLVAEVSYVRVDLDSGLASADENGFGLGVGLRAHAWEDVQLEAGIAYVDLDDAETSVAFAGRYYLTQTVAVGLGLSFSDDADSWSFSFRSEF